MDALELQSPVEGLRPPAQAVARHARAAWTCLVFAISLAIASLRISARPFWLDETFTIDRARLPLAHLIHNSLANHHLPTYFLLIHAILPADNAQLIARLPSAVFGAASVALVFLAGWRIAGWAAGVGAALILGLSPSLIGFSQEARSYTMVMACIMVALHGMIGILRPSRSGRPAPPRGAWTLYGLGTLGAILVLGDAILWMIFVNLAMIPLLMNKAWRQGRGWPWLIVNLLILAAAAPFYWLMNTTVHGHYIRGFAWIPALDRQRLWSILASVYLERIGDSVSFRLMPVSTPRLVLGLLAIGLPMLAAAGLWRLRGQPALRRVLLIAFAGLPVLLILVSLIKPVLLPRYLFWSAAPFALLAGIGIAAIGKSRHGPLLQASALAVMAVLLAVNLAPYYRAETKPRWDIAAGDLARDMRPGDQLFLSDKGGIRVLRLYVPAAAVAAVLGHVTGQLAVAKAAMAAGHRVWMVYGRAGQGLSPGWYAYAAQIASLGQPALFETAGQRIRIGLFDPANEAAPAACSGAQPAVAAPLASLPQPADGRCG